MLPGKRYAENQEGKIKQKEQLLKEHAKWTEVYMRTHKQIDDLLTSITLPPLIEKFIAISQQLEELEKLKADAWNKMLEIQMKLSHLE